MEVLVDADKVVKVDTIEGVEGPYGLETFQRAQHRHAAQPSRILVHPNSSHYTGVTVKEIPGTGIEAGSPPGTRSSVSLVKMEEGAKPMLIVADSACEPTYLDVLRPAVVKYTNVRNDISGFYWPWLWVEVPASFAETADWLTPRS
ncbi:MAG: hypothetical protein M3Y08_17510 [Fibrobacterota bacterium]|nr:hypothetical protein [Fibrobacterota bacterium]